MSARLSPTKIYARDRLAEITKQLLNSIEDLSEAQYLESHDLPEVGIGIECALHHMKQMEGALIELTNYLNIPMPEVQADPIH